MALSYSITLTIPHSWFLSHFRIHSKKYKDILVIFQLLNIQLVNMLAFIASFLSGVKLLVMPLLFMVCTSNGSQAESKKRNSILLLISNQRGRSWAWMMRDGEESGWWAGWVPPKKGFGTSSSEVVRVTFLKDRCHFYSFLNHGHCWLIIIGYLFWIRVFRHSSLIWRTCWML